MNCWSRFTIEQHAALYYMQCSYTLQCSMLLYGNLEQHLLSLLWENFPLAFENHWLDMNQILSN